MKGKGKAGERKGENTPGQLGRGRQNRGEAGREEKGKVGDVCFTGFRGTKRRRWLISVMRPKHNQIYSLSKKVEKMNRNFITTA